MKLRTIVADDEALSAQWMVRLLAPYHQELELIGIAENGQAAVEMINRLEPELVFLDVEMTHLNGLEVSQRVRHRPKMEVFFSASGGYRAKAEARGFAFICKPVGPDDIQKLMKRILAALAARNGRKRARQD